MAPKSSEFTEDEKMLLADFGRGLTRKSSAIFYFHSLVVSALPLWLFTQIQQMDIVENAILFGVGTVVSLFLVAYAYKNNKFMLKHKIAQSRAEGVAAEVQAMISESGDAKKVSKKERDERILWRKNEVAEAESIQLAVFNTNLLFLMLVVVFAFGMLRNYAPVFNYGVSMLMASGLTAFLSTSSQK